MSSELLEDEWSVQRGREFGGLRLSLPAAFLIQGVGGWPDCYRSGDPTRSLASSFLRVDLPVSYRMYRNVRSSAVATEDMVGVQEMQTGTESKNVSG